MQVSNTGAGFWTLTVEALGEAEVNELEAAVVGAAREDDVGGLEVAVHDDRSRSWRWWRTQRMSRDQRSTWDGAVGSDADNHLGFDELYVMTVRSFPCIVEVVNNGLIATFALPRSKPYSSASK